MAAAWLIGNSYSLLDDGMQIRRRFCPFVIEIVIFRVDCGKMSWHAVEVWFDAQLAPGFNCLVEFVWICRHMPSGGSAVFDAFF